MSADHDLLRQAFETRTAALPVPSGATAWTASTETLEVFRRAGGSSRAHRSFCVGLGRSVPTSMPQVVGEPVQMRTAVAVEAWWRLTPHGQDDTRDTGWYALTELVRGLRSEPFQAHLVLESMEVILAAEPEWVRLTSTWHCLHMAAL